MRIYLTLFLVFSLTNLFAQSQQIQELDVKKLGQFGANIYPESVDLFEKLGIMQEAKVYTKGLAYGIEFMAGLSEINKEGAIVNLIFKMDETLGYSVAVFWDNNIMEICVFKRKNGIVNEVLFDSQNIKDLPRIRTNDNSTAHAFEFKNGEVFIFKGDLYKLSEMNFPKQDLTIYIPDYDYKPRLLSK